MIWAMKDDTNPLKAATSGFQTILMNIRLKKGKSPGAGNHNFQITNPDSADEEDEDDQHSQSGSE